MHNLKGSVLGARCSVVGLDSFHPEATSLLHLVQLINTSSAVCNSSARQSHMRDN